VTDPTPDAIPGLIAARYLCLGVPIALLLLAAMAGRAGRRDRAAALLAFLAALLGIAALHEVAKPAGWYAFTPVAGAFRGLPVDAWIGWAVLWGPIPVLLHRTLPLPVALGFLLLLDLVTMPLLTALVTLGPQWLVAEAVGLLAVALPAQLLGRWTAQRRRLRARLTLQVAVFSGLALWLIPTMAFTLGEGSWHRLAELPAPWLLLLAQLGGLAAVPGLAAVREFAVRGNGTPYPWDPPLRLVTTGPYTYLANPMQVSMIVLLLLLAATTRSATLAAGAVLAGAFAVAVAAPHEQDDLRRRFGPHWCAYRRQVRAWWPRLRPYQAARPGQPATLWLDTGCRECRATEGFLRRRHPSRLRLAPAGTHDRTLRRARYEDGDGHRERGVAAVARGLEHVHLGWAYVGWLLRLPGLGALAQLVTDALVAPPHPARATTSDPRGDECPRPVPPRAAPGRTPSSAYSTGPSPRSSGTASPGSPPVPSPPPPE
jgi:protein-S-isoprenylcysteine O-methyltransferase Ste14